MCQILKSLLFKEICHINTTNQPFPVFVFHKLLLLVDIFWWQEVGSRFIITQSIELWVHYFCFMYVENHLRFKWSAAIFDYFPIHHSCFFTMRITTIIGWFNHSMEHNQQQSQFKIIPKLFQLTRFPPR